MIYQTYGALAINPVELRSVEPSIISLAGIGDIKCVPMSNLNIWSGAVVLCTWSHEPINHNPSAMYLVDAEGDVHQFCGVIDALMYEGVIFDLTIPYSNILNVAEQILMIATTQDDIGSWWNEYVEYSIVANLQNTDLLKYALSLSKKYNWSSDIIEQIKSIKVKPTPSPIHRIKRSHYLEAEHEHRFVRHTG